MIIWIDSVFGTACLVLFTSTETQSDIRKCTGSARHARSLAEPGPVVLACLKVSNQNDLPVTSATSPSNNRSRLSLKVLQTTGTSWLLQLDLVRVFVSMNFFTSLQIRIPAEAQRPRFHLCHQSWTHMYEAQDVLSAAMSKAFFPNKYQIKYIHIIYIYIVFIYMNMLHIVTLSYNSIDKFLTNLSKFC